MRLQILQGKEPLYVPPQLDTFIVVADSEAVFECGEAYKYIHKGSRS